MVINFINSIKYFIKEMVWDYRFIFVNWMRWWWDWVSEMMNILFCEGVGVYRVWDFLERNYIDYNWYLFILIKLRGDFDK